MKFIVAEGAASGKPAWWLVDHDGSKLAWSGKTFADQAAALAACNEFKAASGNVTYEVYLDTREQPRWRVRNERGATIALASTAFATRSLAVTAAHRVRTDARSAIGP